MSVVLSASGVVKPGMYPEFLAQASEISKMYQRLGAAIPPRLMSAGLAGEATGTWNFNIEYDDLDSFGEAMDRQQSDEEHQAFMLRLQEPNNPSTVTSVVAASELPLGETKGGRGPVMAVFATKILPGGLERSLELGVRANAFAETHGAVRARLFNLMGAGSAAGLYTSTWEFPNILSYTKVMGAFATEPEGQAIAAAASAADAPNVLVLEAVYTEIPI